MNAETRPFERVATALRQRLAAGEWRPGEMVPGRRILAAEYGVAAATLERAIGVLIAAGVLTASDRRGTFVSGRPPATAPTPGTSPSLGTCREALRATVGIMAGVIPYDSPEMRAGQWPAQILSGCEHGLSGEPGLTQRFLNLVSGSHREFTPAAAAQQLLAAGVDALVIIGVSEVTEVLQQTEAAGIPVVCVAYDPVDATVPQVYLDNVTGGALAARHLRERGFRNLTFLRPFASVWSEARLAGAQSAVGPHTLRVFPPATSQPGQRDAGADRQRAAGLETGSALLKVGFERGTGVMAPNDTVAMGFMEAAREGGLEAGRDYGLVGFDDAFRDAHLTSLRPPLAQLGMEAANLVVRLLRGEAAPARIALQHRLIVRASTLV